MKLPKLTMLFQTKITSLTHLLSNQSKKRRKLSVLILLKLLFVLLTIILLKTRRHRVQFVVKCEESCTKTGQWQMKVKNGGDEMNKKIDRETGWQFTKKTPGTLKKKKLKIENVNVLGDGFANEMFYSNSQLGWFHCYGWTCRFRYG